MNPVKYLIATIFMLALSVGLQPVQAQTASGVGTGDEPGSPKESMKLALMLLEGREVERDVERAIAIYREFAERELVYAQYRLARIYLDGEHVAPDHEEAQTWLQRAALQGYVDAQLELSRLYTGEQGIEQNLVDAYKWLSIADSLTDRDLSSRMQELEERMSFFDLTRARYLSRRCIYRGYVDCE